MPRMDMQEWWYAKDVHAGEEENGTTINKTPGAMPKHCSLFQIKKKSQNVV